MAPSTRVRPRIVARSRLARADERILLTRDRGLARLAEPHGCLIRGERIDDQVIEAVQRLALSPDRGDWLSRCLAVGNHEFSKAEKALRASLEALALPEVRYFLDTFVPSFKLTLDELG